MLSRPPHICVVSRIPGLRAALDARGVNTAGMEWHAELDSPAAQQSLARCDVMLGEPADGAHAASWLAATGEQGSADTVGAGAAGAAEEGVQARLAAAVEALARMELRAVSAELALSEARQVHCV